MGLFSLKGRAGFLGRSRRSIAELQDLGRTATVAGLRTLSKLTQTPIETGVPRVSLVPRDAVGSVLQPLSPAAIAARFALRGAVPGTVGTCFDQQNALALVELLLGGEKGSAKRLGDLEESAVAEMTNIALNGAITAIAAAQDVHFDTAVPEVAYRVKDVGAFLAFEAPPEIDHAVVVETPFTEPTRGVRGTMLLVFGVHRLDES